jgi:Xaa-Pro aminopeptidase
MSSVDHLDRRRTKVAARWALSDEIVLVSSGKPIPIEGSDQYHSFMTHPEFRYLTDSDTPEAVLAFDAATREWQMFTQRLTTDELLWEQAPDPVGQPLDELDAWLAQRGNRKVVRAGSGGDPALSKVLAEVRLHKDEAELDSLRRAASFSVPGYDWVFREVRAGMTEREVQIGMEAEFFRAGSPRTAYDSIVAGGPNGAVLHFMPTNRVIKPGELLLIDAGAACNGYASDVTRTMVVGAEPTEAQRFLWELILRTHEMAIDRCRPGVEWRDVHLDAARMIGTGLIEFGLLRGEIGDLISEGAVAVFFPHGLGHMIGITVHDAGGYRADRERSSHPQLRYLRTDRPLEAGMITSVEPGVYFIEALLTSEEIRQRHADSINWAMADSLRGFGGIRIEDDIHITTAEPENLTAAIPKPLRIG